MFAFGCGLYSLAIVTAQEPLGTSSRVGPQAHLPGEGSKPSCLKLPELTLGSEALADLPWGAPDQSEGNTPGSRVHVNDGNGALHLASGNMPAPSSASALGDLRHACFPL